MIWTNEHRKREVEHAYTSLVRAAEFKKIPQEELDRCIDNKEHEFYAKLTEEFSEDFSVYAHNMFKETLGEHSILLSQKDGSLDVFTPTIFTRFSHIFPRYAKLNEDFEEQTRKLRDAGFEGTLDGKDFYLRPLTTRSHDEVIKRITNLRDVLR